MRETVQNNDIEFDIGITNFKDDQIVNIQGLVVEFNVYEDIFSPVIKADFLIKDAVGVSERLPIVGDEKIILRYKTAGERRFVNLVFSVYKITQRTILEERSHGYVIHAVSREGIKNLNSIEEGSYTNSRISDIVNTVYNNQIKPIGDKNLVTEDTAGFHSFIATKQTPFEFISLLGSEAQSAVYPSTSSFVFYEDVSNFNFRSLSSMFDSEKVDDFYLADPSDEKLRDGKESIKSYQSIIGISFENAFDTLGGLNNGMYKNTVYTLDTILKKFNTRNFDYVQDFDQLTHIDSKRFISDVGDIGSSGVPSHQRFISSRITNNEYAKESYLNTRVTNTSDVHLASPRRRQFFLNNSISEMQNFSQYTMNVSIPGNSLLKAGNLINVFVPQNSDINEQIQKYLLLFGQTNPTFLISAIKHNYKSTTGAYTSTMNVMKESFGTTIKSEYKSKDRGNEV